MVCGRGAKAATNYGYTCVCCCVDGSYTSRQHSSKLLGRHGQREREKVAKSLLCVLAGVTNAMNSSTHTHTVATMMLLELIITGNH